MRIESQTQELFASISERAYGAEFEGEPLWKKIHAVASGCILAAEAIVDERSIDRAAIDAMRSKIRAIYLDLNERLESLPLLQRLATKTMIWLMGSHLRRDYTAFDEALILKKSPLKPAHSLNLEEPDELEPSHFGKDFAWGVGTCEYQLSGSEHCPHNQWASWEKEHVRPEHQTGTSTDHWARISSDVERIADLGVNSYRFSVEWSEIEPNEGEINLEAVNHYIELCDRLIEKGIAPCVTLHHFTHPQWFEEKGAFEKPENIDHLVNFTRVMVEALGDRVSTYFTINEPNVYATLSYHSGFIGNFPPNGSYRYKKMHEVFANLLQAHDKMYDAIKELAQHETRVGIIHQALEFEAYSLLETPITSYMNWIFLNEAFAHFARTGELRLQTPLGEKTIYVSDEPKGDFIGINYYSRPLVSLFSGHEDFQAYEEGEALSDMHFRTHSKGLQSHLRRFHAIGKPIIITENGIADAADSRRAHFIQQQLDAIQAAIKEGVNLDGYFHWSLFDNAEWEHGIGVKNFGLYAVDFESKERTLRGGARPFIEAIESWRVHHTPEADIETSAPA